MINLCYCYYLFLISLALKTLNHSNCQMIFKNISDQQNFKFLIPNYYQIDIINFNYLCSMSFNILLMIMNQKSLYSNFKINLQIYLEIKILNSMIILISNLCFLSFQLLNYFPHLMEYFEYLIIFIMIILKIKKNVNHYLNFIMMLKCLQM